MRSSGLGPPGSAGEDGLNRPGATGAASLAGERSIRLQPLLLAASCGVILMNAELMVTLAKLDSAGEPVDEHYINRQINAVAQDDDSQEAIAERTAFGFREDAEGAGADWGTYFGPMMVWQRDDGQAYESPSIKAVTEEMLRHWGDRATRTSNPLMKARYAGLVWDLTEPVTGTKPNYSVAIEYVQALLEVCDRDFTEHPTETITKTKRAYQVARSLNSQDLIERCIASAIALEDRIARDEMAGLWGFCFELFVLGKESLLSGDQKTKIISDLEARLGRVVVEDNPWVVESAGVPLATYYRSTGSGDDVRRVVETVGSSFERSAEGKSPLMASSLYQHAHDLYVRFNFNDLAEAVTLKIRDVGPDVVADMREISHSMKVPEERLESYLHWLTDGGLEAALGRIAVQFVPKRGEVEEQVRDLASRHPLSYLFTTMLQDHRGRPIATIGSVEEDLEGHIIRQIDQNHQVDSFFLRHALDRVKLRYSASSEQLRDYLIQSPLFEEQKYELLTAGLEAYDREDLVTAIHVLIPQIESAIRVLVELSGGATMKRNRLGGLQLRTLDDLLRDATVVSCFGEDSAFYLRILLTDQRGWNVRNDVCHGISPAAAFGYPVADRAIHVLLLLAMVRQTKDEAEPVDET